MFVQSLSYNNPINALNEITSELRIANFEGVVIFDLLLTNGNSSGRFIESIFAKQQFHKNTFQKTTVPKPIRKEIIFYYKKNKRYLANSVLSQTSINFIINEQCLEKE